MAVEDDRGDGPCVATPDPVEGHLTPREQGSGLILRAHPKCNLTRTFGLIAMRFRGVDPGRS
jgi:hypothetical protein